MPFLKMISHYHILLSSVKHLFGLSVNLFLWTQSKSKHLQRSPSTFWSLIRTVACLPQVFSVFDVALTQTICPLSGQHWAITLTHGFLAHLFKFPSKSSQYQAMPLSKELSKFSPKSFSFLVSSPGRFTLLTLPIRHVWSCLLTDWRNMGRFADHKNKRP